MSLGRDQARSGGLCRWGDAGWHGSDRAGAIVLVDFLDDEALAGVALDLLLLVAVQADHVADFDARSDAADVIGVGVTHVLHLQTAGPGEDTALDGVVGVVDFHEDNRADDRSEERRVGKECRSRWSPPG